MFASRIATRTALLLLGALLTTAVPSAFAHTGASAPPTISSVAPVVNVGSPAVAGRAEVLAATPTAAVPLWLVLLGLALAVLLVKAPRRVAVSAFAVLLAVIAFETGVHAVHHLGDTHAASRCVVASVTPQLGAATEAPAPGTPHLSLTADAVVVSDALVLPARPLCPSPGRAPPALAA